MTVLLVEYPSIDVSFIQCPEDLIQILLAFKVSAEKSAVILIGYLCMLFVLSLYSLQYSFSILCACCFNDNMLLCSFILVKSVWCPGGFL
jgi:hypothetical protein